MRSVARHNMGFSGFIHEKYMYGVRFDIVILYLPRKTSHNRFG